LDAKFENYEDEEDDQQDKNAGMNIITSMMLKPQPFVINVGTETRKERQIEYRVRDPIFGLSAPNERTDHPDNQNPFCNSCLEPYRNQKEVRYCEFCALAVCPRCRFKCR